MSMPKLFLDGIDVNRCALPPWLPLVHTTNSKRGMEFLHKGSLTKPPVCEKCKAEPCSPCDKKPPICEKCEVFPKDNPVYLFYGRPTYSCPT